jgi:hypothetical protein
MGKPVRRSRSWGAAVAVGLCAALAARQAAAHQVVVPEQLTAGNQVFDASPAGFRAYLDTVRTTNPDLFARLAPEADQLVSRGATGRHLAIAGAAVGVAVAVIGIASAPSCYQPSVSDPNFAADTAAWGNCNDSKINRIAIVSLAGLGLAAAGAIAWAVMAPSRADLMNLVNQTNRLDPPQPLQFQLGYDPTQHLAQAGATLSF